MRPKTMSMPTKIPTKTNWSAPLMREVKACPPGQQPPSLEKFMEG